MARKVFYSFYYDEDNWRASKVRNIGAIEGNQPAKDNDWETVKRGGDLAIERWIKGQMEGRTCSIVLIGANTLIGEGKEIPPRSMVLGSPGKIVRQLTDDDVKRFGAGAGRYVTNGRRYAAGFKPQS